MTNIESLATSAIETGLRLHRHLGPGLLESVYESLLAAALSRDGFVVHRQVPITISYDGLVLKDAFKADLLIERILMIEVKSIEKLAPIHSKQLLTYLRVSNRPLGLLMNFGGVTFKDGLKRVVNEHHPANPVLRVNAPLP